MKTKNLINIDNIYIDKTFRDFMESIRNEVQSLVDGNKTELLYHNIPVTIELDAQWYDFSEYDIPAAKHASCIVWARIKFGGVEFGIGDFEFARYFDDKKGLDNLVQVRIIDGLWSVEDIRERRFETLRRCYPDWKTSDDYLH